MLFTPIQISPAAWLSWKNNPETREIMSVLAAEREEWVKRLTEGDTLIPGQEVIDTAKAVGIIYGLDCLLIGIEEVLKRQWEEKEEEQNG
jgi:hypothetical protein